MNTGDVITPAHTNADAVEISIVVPVLNEEGNIFELYKRVRELLEDRLQLSFELLFVDDGSRDRSWEIIETLNRNDPRVKGLRFSRNFGHQKAIKAGLDASTGAAVISMDCDLQHPPALIETMIGKWREGYDTVNMVKTSTEKLGFFRAGITKLGYGIINLFSEVRMQPGGSDFRLLDRHVVEQIKRLSEDRLLLRGIVSWLGFRVVHIEYKAEERFAGRSQYTFRKLASLVISGLMSFSTAPLRMVVYMGLVVALGSFSYGLYLFTKWLLYGVVISGWLTIVLLILLVGGTILLVLGIIGEYVARIYEGNQKRPEYILLESTGQPRRKRSPPG
ncbi:MAG: glycosyltransferase family 2 protein [Magnetococcales bacterium]|nr:glycosyltransferase family 2 protein [Magnetococcales bacterium]